MDEVVEATLNLRFATLRLVLQKPDSRADEEFLAQLLADIRAMPALAQFVHVTRLAKMYVDKIGSSAPAGPVYGLEMLLRDEDAKETFCRTTVRRRADGYAYASVISKLLTTDIRSCPRDASGRPVLYSVPVDTLFEYGIKDLDGHVFMVVREVSAALGPVFAGCVNGYGTKMLKLVRAFPEVLHIQNGDGRTLFSLVLALRVPVKDRFYILAHATPTDADLHMSLRNLDGVVSLVEAWRDNGWRLPVFPRKPREMAAILVGNPAFAREHTLIREFVNGDYLKAVRLLKLVKRVREALYGGGNV